MGIDTYSETALISITPSGYGELRFQTLTDSLDPSGGKKGVEYLPTLSGGRKTKHVPQEPFTITMDLYPLQVGTAIWPDQTTTTSKVATGIHDIMDGAEDTAQPLAVTFDRTKRPVRLTILFTENPALTSAEAGVTGLNMKSKRYSYADGYLTELKPGWDGVEKITATFEFPAYDDNGVCCSFFESTIEGTGNPLTALVAYTAGAATKFK